MSEPVTMLRNYFKVTEDFQSSVVVGENLHPCENISVEKGDIIVDVRNLDNEFLTGKILVSQKVIRIPKQCVEELKDDSEMDDTNADECRSRCSSAEEEDNRRKSTLSNGSGKRISLDRKTNGIVCNRRSREEEVILDKVSDEYVPIISQNGASICPKAPPRTKKKCDSARETFRSRESDEGYNSCSHYSGEKPPDNEQKSRSSYYNTPIGADIPVLSSFGASPQRTSSPRPSVQDEDGYEIPSFVQRTSVVNDEVATGDEKGVTLKFIFQRKSTNGDEKFAESLPLNGKFHLGSIGENSESIYETWETDQKISSSSDEKKKAKKDRMLVLLYFVISIVLSISIFIVLLLVPKTAALLAFAAAVNIFATSFVGFLTMGKRRWLCIATLLAPSLFSKKVKVGLCITLLVLIIAGPICNISRNLTMVLSCKNIQNASENIILTSAQNSQVSKERSDVKKFPIGSQFGFKKYLANSTISPKLVDYFSEQCKATLRNAFKKSVNDSCSEQDTSCVLETFQSRFSELCRNISIIQKEKLTKRYLVLKELKKIAMPDYTFRLILLQCLPLLLLLILHEAYWYNRDYLSNKEMDNVYITGKLKALDQDRKERGMKNLLFPLRKLEFRSYVLPSSFLQTSQESKQIFQWVIVWISLGLAVLLCILLDKSVHQALSFLVENSLSTCDIELKTLDQNLVYSLCIFLALLIIAIIFQSYVLRCRSRICSYFYPKKESSRGVFLYHKILRDRAAFWKACKDRGRMLSESRRTRWKIGVCHRLFRAMPRIVRVALEKLFIYRCIICNSLTFRKSIVCNNDDCYSTFCYDCFIDIGQSCISCRPGGARDSVFATL